MTTPTMTKPVSAAMRSLLRRHAKEISDLIDRETDEASRIEARRDDLFYAYAAKPGRSNGGVWWDMVSSQASVRAARMTEVALRLQERYPDCDVIFRKQKKATR